MTPTDHRLDHVAARLLERLEGSRRSWVEPGVLSSEVTRVAREHLAPVQAEIRELAAGTEGAAQADFLERELLHTVLPRYVEIARAQTALERRGYGLGPLAHPIGRVVAGVGALLVTWLVLLRFLYLPEIWPLVPLVFSIPVWPDVAARLARRQLARDLQALVDDAARIQEQADPYSLSASPGVERLPAAAPARRAATRELE